MNLTKEQRAALDSRGKVIVSASAGSGKTFVMIERLVSIILSGVDVRNTLCVTYTNKAAAQMKQRLRAALLKRIGESGEAERARIKEQLAALPSAEICTVHAFCSRLVRTNFFLADVAPGFRVIAPEDAEGSTLGARALDETFEALYAEGGEDAERLLAVFFRSKKDAALRKLTKKLYAKVRIKADYRALLESAGKEDDFDRVSDFLKEEYAARARLIAEEAEALEPSFEEVNETAFRICKELADCAGAVSSAAGLEALRALPKPKFSTSPDCSKFEGRALRALERQRAITADIKKLYAEFAKIGNLSVERERCENARRTARALAGLLLRYDEAYSRLKKEAGVLDYNDLEHCALKVLENEAVRAALREKYRYVFVDEYQDVNPAEEKILSLLEGDEVFLVGDYKQAIYGFRGGRSEYFVRKERSFPLALPLSENFRSAPAVLEAVNRVFRRAMTEESSGVNFRLMSGGARYGEHEGAVHFHRVTEETPPPRERGIYSVLGKVPPKEDAVAERIASLVEEEVGSDWYDADAGLMKKVTYGDIAVLVRKNFGCAEAVVNALGRRNIPVTTTATVNVCDFWEVRLLIDWLSYLDDAEQDIPLASALLSRLGGCTEEDLAEIRLKTDAFAEKNGSRAPYTFRQACREYRRRAAGGELFEKLGRFFARAERYRALMRVRTAAEMIALLLSDGLEAQIAAKRDGEARLRRVRRFLEEAAGSVGDFLRRLRRTGFNVEYSESAGDSSVKVLTVHTSKGLEYPVVLLADLNTPFHRDWEEVLFTDPFGIAPRCYDTEKKLVYETLTRRASMLYLEREDVKAELNLLYVAMTRAKYRLHLLFGKTEAALFPSYAKKFADFFDFEDCIGYFAPPPEREEAPPEIRALAYRADEETLNSLRAVYRREYPYAESTTLPVKTSATELLKEEPARAARAARGAGGSAVEEGLAYHAFLQHVRFGSDPAEELARMEREGLIPPERLVLLSPERLAAMLALPSLRGLSGKRVMREQTFLVSLPAREIFPVRTEDEVIVQGAIDLLAEDEEGYLILDYKYSSRGAAALKESYMRQIALYRKAVARTTGADERTVRARILNIKELFEIEL